MSEITDEYIRGMIEKIKPYTVVILRRTTKIGEPGADRIVWEHGRKNLAPERWGSPRRVSS